MKKNNHPQKISLSFIGGTGRSGTTILKKIFARHPDVSYVPEWRFSIDPDGIVDFFNTFSTGWSPYLFDVKLKRLEKLLKNVGKSNNVYRYMAAALHYSGLDRKIPYKLFPAYAYINATAYCPNYLQLVDELIGKLSSFRYPGIWVGSTRWESSIIYGSAFEKDELARILGDFVRQVAWCAVTNQNAKHYVEDNTWNILCFDKLLQLVPEAKLVHIYRDPRDVVASYTKQRWSPTDPAQAAQFYKDIMERWWFIRQHIPPDSFKEVALEELVSNPKEVLSSICQFWGIEWNDVLLETDLSHSDSGRWKRDFTAKQQELICCILEKQISELGYDNERL